jgi:hypothetical protein
MITINSRFLLGPRSLVNGIQAYWSLDSTYADITGNGHTLTSSTGNVQWNYSQGKWGGSAYMPYTGSYNQLLTAAGGPTTYNITNTTGFSFGGWWYMPWANANYSLVGFHSGGGEGSGTMLYRNATNTYEFRIGTGQSFINTPATSSTSNGTCYHMCTYDTKVLRHFIWVSTSEYSWNEISYSGPFNIGTETFKFNINGSSACLDEWGLWNRGLTRAEVEGLFRSYSQAGGTYNPYQKFSVAAHVSPIPLIRP